MPRALYWFRWGAMYTWVSGLLLIGIVYMAGNAMGNDRMSSHLAGTIGIVIAVGRFLHLRPALEATEERDGRRGGELRPDAVLVFAESRFMGGRALFLFAARLRNHHDVERLDADLPSQRKIIAGVKGTAAAPDPSVPRSPGCAASTTPT